MNSNINYTHTCMPNVTNTETKIRIFVPHTGVLGGVVVPLTGEEIHGGPIDPGLLVQEPLHPQPDRHSHHLRPVCQKMKTKINNFVNFIQSKIFKFLRRLEINKLTILNLIYLALSYMYYLVKKDYLIFEL